MKKVLLLVSYFPPDNHVGSWRWARLSEKLIEKDCVFHVVTSDNKNNAFYEWNDSDKYLSITRIKNAYNSSLRFHYSKLKSFLEKKKDTNNKNEAHKSSGRSYKELSLIGKIRRYLSLVIDFPDFSWNSSNSFFKAGSHVIEINDIDIIIASHPYVGCLRAAKKLSNKYQIPWIADMRDGWTGNLFSPYHDFHSLYYFLKIKERRLLSTASKVVTINKQLSNVILYDNNKTKIISNSFDKSSSIEHTRVFENEGSNIETIDIVFSGTIKSDHNFYPFLDAICQFNNMHGNVVKFHYYGRSFDLIKRYASLINLDLSSVINHGYVTIDEVESAIKNADILVIFGWLGRFADTYQTGKVFDYLKSKTPILAIDSNNSALADTINECNVGKVTKEPDEICKFMLNAVKKNELEKIVSSYNHDAINQFSVANTSDMYIKVINEVLNKL